MHKSKFNKIFIYNYYYMQFIIKSTRTFKALLLTLVIVGSSYAFYAYAGAGENTRGFAWGGTDSVDGAYNGLGWISMNSISDGSATSYGVNIPLINGPLSGYAGCAPALTQATRSGSSITGGARIIAIRDAVIAGNAGGYDGCISLGGTATDGTPYGLTISGSASPLSVNGNIWSSDLGYVSFSGTCSCGSGTYQVEVTYSAPSLSARSASNCTIPVNGNSCNSTVTWTIANSISPSVRQNTTQFSTLATSAGVSRAISYGSGVGNTMNFYDNGTLLGSVTPTASCAGGSSWNGSLCSANVACNDGVDNDGDGDTDFGVDLGCTSPTDTTENDPIVAPTLSPTPRLVEQGSNGTLTWNTNGANEALLLVAVSQLTHF
jgi:hypothetical protein